MPSRDEVLASLRDSLTLSDPGWDISPGTPEYKILEAVAQEIENLTYDSVLSDYHFDIDKKSGPELDQFVGLFGFSRIPAQKAAGTVTFSRGSAAGQDYPISLATQVFAPANAVNPSIYFQTTVNVALTKNSTTVVVPVEAVVAGSAGNVTAGAITSMASAVGGITNVINILPMLGGTDSETDGDLRDRWRRTVFRNISGTEDQFIAICLNDSAVARTLCLGPISRYSEQLQIPNTCYDANTLPNIGGGTTYQQTTLTNNPLTSGGTSMTVTSASGFPGSPTVPNPFYIQVENEIMKVTNVSGTTFTLVRGQAGTTASAHVQTTTLTLIPLLTSTVVGSAYTYPTGGDFFGHDMGLSTEDLGQRNNDYVLLTSVPATFLVLNSTKYPTGDVVDLEHEYCASASRNVPGSGTLDKVDLFVNASETTTVTESVPFSTAASSRFGTAAGTPNAGNLDQAQWLRDDGITNPISQNYFLRLFKNPLMSVPSSITVAGTTFYKDQDYFFIKDISDYQGSPRASEGLEWNAPYTPRPAAAPTFVVNAGLGKITPGWHAYVQTFFVNGQESLPSNVSATNNFIANDAATVTINTVGSPPAGTVWRRLYRSRSSVSTGAAAAGPFYLIKTFLNNTVTSWQDTKADSALKTIQPPQFDPTSMNGTLFQVTYGFGSAVERLDAQVNLVRLVGMDTLVHRARPVNLKFNLAVVLNQGVSPTTANANISNVLDNWLSHKSFAGDVQVADVIEIAGLAAGIDNIRLLKSGEARNEVQIVTVSGSDAVNDTYRLTVQHSSADQYQTGLIAFNADRTTTQQALEALPTIQEGDPEMGTLAAQIANPGDTSASVTLNHGAWPATPFYIRIESEYLRVTNISGVGPYTFTVTRGVLGSTAPPNVSHANSKAVEVVGDVAVVQTSTSPYVNRVTFLPNSLTGVDNWGNRIIPLMSAATQGGTSVSISEKKTGSGYGIQIIATNGSSITNSYTTDFYLAPDQLPALFDVVTIPMGRNTF